VYSSTEALRGPSGNAYVEVYQEKGYLPDDGPATTMVMIEACEKDEARLLLRR
jgi:hypothetical protein